MGRDKEICHGKPTRPSRFRLEAVGGRIKVRETVTGAHECVVCGLVYPAGVGQAEFEAAFTKLSEDPKEEA